MTISRALTLALLALSIGGATSAHAELSVNQAAFNRCYDHWIAYGPATPQRVHDVTQACKRANMVSQPKLNQSAFNRCYDHWIAYGPATPQRVHDVTQACKRASTN